MTVQACLGRPEGGPGNTMLAPGVTWRLVDGTAWVVSVPASGKHFRVGGRTIAVLDALARGEAAPDLPVVSDRLERAGVLVSADEPPPPRPQRLHYLGPFQIQFNVIDPDRGLDRLQPLLRRAFGTGGQIVGWLFAAVGLAVLALRPAALAPAAAAISFRPWPLVALLALLAAGVVVHEFAHAATLKAHGGRVRGMGVMLFYLMPAAFCDVSDAWMLDRWPRMAVSLAGIQAQLVLSTLAFGGAALAPPDVGAVLLLFAVMNVTFAVWNVFPLVKLDGYWALSAALGVQNLRSRALAALVGLLGVFRGRPAPRPGEREWLLAGYALLSLLAVPLLLIGGVVSYARLLGDLLPSLDTADTILLVVAGAVAVSVGAKAWTSR